MKRRLTIAAFCLFVPAFLAPQARGQCPPGNTNPLQVFTGVWTFKAQGFNLPPFHFLAAAGRFSATVGTNQAGAPVGILAITESTSVDGNPTRLDTETGRFQVNADCSGGTLNLNSAGRPDQYDFYFANANEIYFVGTNNGDNVSGRAQRAVAAGCPANPLSALAGTWAFTVDGFRFVPVPFDFNLVAAAGHFAASIGTDRNGNPIGVLAITQSSSLNGSPTRQEGAPGRYQLNGDCSGGTLTFDTGSLPVQYDFFFGPTGELVTVGSNNGTILTGRAKQLF